MSKLKILFMMVIVATSLQAEDVAIHNLTRDDNNIKVSFSQRKNDISARKHSTSTGANDTGWLAVPAENGEATFKNMNFTSTTRRPHFVFISEDEQQSQESGNSANKPALTETQMGDYHKKHAYIFDISKVDFDTTTGFTYLHGKDRLRRLIVDGKDRRTSQKAAVVVEGQPQGGDKQAHIMK